MSEKTAETLTQNNKSQTGITRCVHVFPRFENSEALNAIREKYDHLHDLIEPHITLVFPFESSLTQADVKEAVSEALKNQNSFKVKAEGLEGVDSHGFYLFLKITDGKDILKKLHYKLHEGALEAYQSPWTRDGSFKPHITLGRFQSQEDLDDAIKALESVELCYETEVTNLHVEVIGDNEESIIESVVDFPMDSGVADMINGLNHVTFAVHDIQTSIDFYTKLFGQDPVAVGENLAYFNISGVWFALNPERDITGENRQRTYTHIAFSMDEDNQLKFSERLKDLGIAYESGRTRHENEGTSLYVRDLDGHLIEFHSRDLNARLKHYKENRPDIRIKEGINVCEDHG